MSKNHQDATSSFCLSDSLLRHMLLAGEFNSTYACTCLEECQVFIIHHIWKQSIQRFNSMADSRILYIYIEIHTFTQLFSQFSHEAVVILCCPPVLSERITVQLRLNSGPQISCCCILFLDAAQCKCSDSFFGLCNNVIV